MWDYHQPHPELGRLRNRIEELERKLDDLEKRFASPRPSRKFLNTKEACSYLEIGRTTLYRYMDHGLLAYHLVGGQRRLTITDLDEFLERNRQEPLPSIL